MHKWKMDLIMQKILLYYEGLVTHKTELKYSTCSHYRAGKAPPPPTRSCRIHPWSINSYLFYHILLCFLADYIPHVQVVLDLDTQIQHLKQHNSILSHLQLCHITDQMLQGIPCRKIMIQIIEASKNLL